MPRFFGINWESGLDSSDNKLDDLKKIIRVSSSKILVTGGGGFLGHAICRALVDRGETVVSIARSSYSALKSIGVTEIQSDIGSPKENFWQAFEGVQAVFHVASKVAMWGRYQDFYRANVVGTQNVIKACQTNGVPCLVYTSSPSVIADGSNLKAVDESYPYPTHYEANYPETKAIAERLVLAANSSKLATLALRPHLIWGPGDTNLVPTILRKAKSGRLKIIGHGSNRVDICFIMDCVEAHLLALKALKENSEASGRPYFISQGEPLELWQWINQILAIHHLPEITKSVSFKTAYKLAGLFEFSTKLFPGLIREPLLTKFLVSEMATDHYFDISAAKKYLGFSPKYSIAEAMRITFGSLTS